MSHDAIFRELRTAVEQTRTESAQVNGIVAVLAKMGMKGADKPNVQALDGRPGWRVYLWLDTPFGDALVLITGTSIPPKLLLGGDVDTEVKAGRVYVELLDMEGVRALRGASRAATRATTPARATKTTSRPRPTSTATAKAQVEARHLGVSADAVLEVATEAAAATGATEVTGRHVDAVVAEVKAHGAKVLEQATARRRGAVGFGRGAMFYPAPAAADMPMYEAPGRGKPDPRIEAERRHKGEALLNKAKTDIAYYREFGGDSYRDKAAKAIDATYQIYPEARDTLEELLANADADRSRIDTATKEKARLSETLERALDAFREARDRNDLAAAQRHVAQVQVAAEAIWASMHTTGREGDRAKEALNSAQRDFRHMKQRFDQQATVLAEIKNAQDNVAQWLRESITADDYPDAQIRELISGFENTRARWAANTTAREVGPAYAELLRTYDAVIQRLKEEQYARESRHKAPRPVTGMDGWPKVKQGAPAPVTLAAFEDAPVGSIFAVKVGTQVDTFIVRPNGYYGIPALINGGQTLDKTTTRNMLREVGGTLFLVYLSDGSTPSKRVIDGWREAALQNLLPARGGTVDSMPDRDASTPVVDTAAAERAELAAALKALLG